MRIVPGEIIAEPDEHVLLVGKINGTVVKSDGTVVDVSPAAVVVKDQKEADEVGHLVGLRYAAEGHPDDPPDATFEYKAPKKFAKYEPHPDNATLVTSED